ncbi:phosphoenolpyruvate carboxylase [Vibrio lentus]|nr:phosphoenolpyruvate carboxylase [Vibrio lentus]
MSFSKLKPKRHQQARRSSSRSRDLNIELVLTAHPTEITRRTMIT